MTPGRKQDDDTNNELSKIPDTYDYRCLNDKNAQFYSQRRTSKRSALRQLTPPCAQPYAPSRREVYIEINDHYEEEQRTPESSRKKCMTRKERGQIVGAEYGIQQTLSGVESLVLAEVKPIAGRYAMFNNPFATNAVKTTQIHSWWYHYVIKVDLAMRNTDPPRAYLSVDCKYRFAGTEIVNLLYETYFAGVRPLGMKDRRMIDMINSTFIVLAATAIHHCLRAWKTREYKVPAEFGSGGGAHLVFCCLEAEFLSTSPEVQTKTIEDVKMMICRRQRWTGVVEVNGSMLYNDQGVHEEEYLSYIPEDLADVSDNTFRRMTAEVDAAQSALLSSRVQYDIISSTVDVSGTSNTNTNNINDNSNDDFNVADTEKYRNCHRSPYQFE
ncbi:hypothetical protein K440DRAFT_641234 [Wilcoxina mikolae CBS 423.85]|nr:hypothetical protein K440DRAFT_641234 [Wilcoxina mikolae CBS 423.85]